MRSNKSARKPIRTLAGIFEYFKVARTFQADELACAESLACGGEGRFERLRFMLADWSVFPQA
jgi:hypothetical protein